MICCYQVPDSSYQGQWHSRPPSRPQQMHFQQHQPPRSNTSNQPPAQAYLIAPDIRTQQAWFPDSEATHRDANNLTDAIQVLASYQTQILMGNGKGFPIHSVGSPIFFSPFQPNKIHRVLLVLHKIIYLFIQIKFTICIQEQNLELSKPESIPLFFSPIWNQLLIVKPCLIPIG